MSDFKFEGFTPLAVTLDLDVTPWSDLEPNSLLVGQATKVGVLPHGTHEGKPSIAIRGELRDGTPVILQTTWNLLYSAALAITSRYGEAR